MKNAAVLTTASDPVCGMTVNPSTAAQRAEHAGVTRHFCGAGCAAKFRKDTAAPCRSAAWRSSRPHLLLRIRATAAPRHEGG